MKGSSRSDDSRGLRAPARLIGPFRGVQSGDAPPLPGCWRGTGLQTGRGPVPRDRNRRKDTVAGPHSGSSPARCDQFVIGNSRVAATATGLQRRLRGDRLLCPGALHYAHEAPIQFGEDPTRDQMAVLTRLDDGRLRLEFPAPLVESRFYVLEFTR